MAIPVPMWTSSASPTSTSISDLPSRAIRILTENSPMQLALYACAFGTVYLSYKLFYQLILYPRFLSPLRKVPGPEPVPLTAFFNPRRWRSLLHDIFIGKFDEIIIGEAGIPQRAWVKQYGPIVKIMGPIGIERLIFTKPEAMRRILTNHEEGIGYPRPKFMRDVLATVTGFGLLTVSGQDHRQMRKAMNPAFALGNLTRQSDMYYDAIEGLIDILNNHIDEAKKKAKGATDTVVLPMYEWCSKATLDIICTTAFGYTADSLHHPENELAHAYDTLTSLQTGPNLARFIAVLSLPLVVPIPAIVKKLYNMTGLPSLEPARLLSTDFATKHRNLFSYLPVTTALVPLLDSMEKILAVSRQMLELKIREANEAHGAMTGDDDASAKRDIMSLLVRARQRMAFNEKKEKRTEDADMDGVDGVDDGYQMSDEAMMDQVLTFLGAGHETTASGLAWTLWLLAKDPESQRRLREEVRPVFADGQRPGYRELKDLNWLDCVVQESLRLMPPVPMTFRQAARTDYIDGVLVPKGTLLYIPIRVINTWSEIWGPDAEIFKPSRWLNLPANFNPTYSTLSFLAGPHACIGKTMAIVEMKAVLGALIANFEFAPSYEGQVPIPTAAVTMKPKDNMPLLVRRAS